MVPHWQCEPLSSRLWSSPGLWDTGSQSTSITPRFPDAAFILGQLLYLGSATVKSVVCLPRVKSLALETSTVWLEVSVVAVLLT